MSFTVTALIVLGVWMLISVLTSFGMARRGHSAFSWALLGGIFGPLVIPLVIEAIAEERDRASRVLRVGARATGPLSVLVGVDGSEESVAAVKAAVTLFGPRLERITLAAVVSYEAAGGTPAQVGDEAAAELEVVAHSFSFFPITPFRRPPLPTPLVGQRGGGGTPGPRSEAEAVGRRGRCAGGRAGASPGQPPPPGCGQGGGALHKHGAVPMAVARAVKNAGGRRRTGVRFAPCRGRHLVLGPGRCSSRRGG